MRATTTSLRGPAAGLLGLTITLAVSATPDASIAAACFVACVGNAPCAIGASGNVLAPGQILAHRQCDGLNTASGALEILPNRGSNCSYVDSECRRSFDKALHEGRGGKGFDSADFFAPMGEPCAMGFPCGTLLKPRDDRDLAFSLEDSGASGQLQIKAMRGASGNMQVDIAHGQVSIPGRALVRAASYSYSYKDRSGAVVGAGQFTVASQAMEQDVREDFADKSKTLRSKELAWIGALLANGMDWDVYRLSRRPAPSR